MKDSPAPPALRAGALDAADAIVAQAVGDAFPGAVLAVGLAGEPLHLKAFGRLSYEADAPAVRVDTVYDLASLTKVVVAATLAMVLVDDGVLDLDAPLRRFYPRFQGPGKDEATIRRLLAHAAGLQAWAPLYLEVSGKPAYLDRILALEPAYTPGTRSLYGDLGMILLGDVLESLAVAPLEDLARRRVLAPLGMHETMYRPPAALRARIAPSEPCPWRGRALQGEVHDENAWALGGVAAHAGLFGTAGDLARFAQAMLDAGEAGGPRIASRAGIRLFTRRDDTPGTTRALGWDTASDASGRRSSRPGEPGYSSAGSLFSARSFGHTGFTGTSLWIDPERELFLILLSNRVHPRPQDLARGARGRDNDQIRGVRSRLADAVAGALARA